MTMSNLHQTQIKRISNYNNKQLFMVQTQQQTNLQINQIYNMINNNIISNEPLCNQKETIRMSVFIQKTSEESKNRALSS